MVADSDMKKQTLMDEAIKVFYEGNTSEVINCYLLNLAYTFLRRYS